LIHAWKDKAIVLGLQLVSVSLFFGQELLNELVVGMLQLLVHACHHSDIVVIYEVDFLEVELFWQRTGLISKEKVADRLSLEWQLCS